MKEIEGRFLLLTIAWSKRWRMTKLCQSSASSALGSLPSIEENAEPLDFPLEREIVIFDLTSELEDAGSNSNARDEVNDPSNVILWQAARRLSRDCRAINLRACRISAR